MWISFTSLSIFWRSFIFILFRSHRDKNKGYLHWTSSPPQACNSQGEAMLNQGYRTQFGSSKWLSGTRFLSICCLQGWTLVVNWKRRKSRIQTHALHLILAKRSRRDKLMHCHMGYEWPKWHLNFWGQCPSLDFVLIIGFLTKTILCFLLFLSSSGNIVFVRFS